ncbi:MAG: type II toxin-antitoxin system HicA family toxin [Gammaproteobacteria bacterium]|nr:MAG: type II toxin-antitoxin system HicA family toxin [Gammaproteobacteria bacterium]
MLAIIDIMCIIHTMKSAELIRELKKAGWYLVRVRGSHHQFTHPGKRYTITVPHPKKDLGKGLIRAIRKQADLEN